MSDQIKIIYDRVAEAVGPYFGRDISKPETRALIQSAVAQVISDLEDQGVIDKGVDGFKIDFIHTDQGWFLLIDEEGE